MINRIYLLNNELDDSIFLFGARQTGKSTALRQQFPNDIYIDLLDTDIRNRLTKRPGLLYEMLKDKPEGTLAIIDEIPEVPELLNEVHRLIFVLSCAVRVPENLSAREQTPLEVGLFRFIFSPL